MEITHDEWYTTPDGTLVQAKRAETLFPVWTFITVDGQPAYTTAPSDELLRCIHDPATGQYHTVPCALTLNDFRLA